MGGMNTNTVGGGAGKVGPNGQHDIRNGWDYTTNQRAASETFFPGTTIPSNTPGLPQGPGATSPPGGDPTLDPSTALQPGTQIPGLPDFTQKGYGETNYEQHRGDIDPNGGPVGFLQEALKSGKNWDGSDITPEQRQGIQQQIDDYQSSHGGALDVAFRNNIQPGMSTPGIGETETQSILDKYNAGGMPKVSNDAERAFQDFLHSQPQSLDPYYNRASDKLSNTMNAALAARGAYGSSAGLDQLGGAMADLRGNEAQANAQYGLQRAGLEGTLGSAADVSSGRISSDARDWATGMAGIADQGETLGLGRLSSLGNFAGATQNADVNRFTAGENAALGAQTAQSTRGQNAFLDAMGLGGALSDIMGQGYNQEFNFDPNAMGQETGLPIASANNDVANAKYSGQENRQTINDLMGGYGDYAKAAAANAKKPPGAG